MKIIKRLMLLDFINLTIIILIGTQYQDITHAATTSSESQMSMAIHILGDFFARDMKTHRNQKVEGQEMRVVLEKFQSLLDDEALFGDLPVTQDIKTRISSAIEINEKKDLYKRIEIIQQKLHQNLPFMCEWGYINTKGGHAMLAEFEPSSAHHFDFEASQKSENLSDMVAGRADTIIFPHQPSAEDMTSDLNRLYNLTIYNTGNGIKYHQVCPNCSSYKIQPFLEYKNIKIEKLMDPDFLSAFLAPQMDSYDKKIFFHDPSISAPYNKDYKPFYMYQVVLQDLYQEMVKTPTSPPVFQKPQLSGTCTVSSIWAFMLKKHHLTNGSEFKKFYKIFKEKIQLKYLKELIQYIDIQSSTLSELNLWRLILEHALSNVARHRMKTDGDESFFLEQNEFRDQILRLGRSKIAEIDHRMMDKPNERHTFGDLMIDNTINQTPNYNKEPKSKLDFIKNTVGLDNLSGLLNSFEKNSFDPVEMLNSIEEGVRNGFEKRDRQLLHLVSSFINTIDIDRIESSLENYLQSHSLIPAQFYKQVTEKVVSLVYFIKRKRTVFTAPEIMALARLNYFGWKAICIWDELIFVPDQLSPSSSEELLQNHPHLFIKNYRFQCKLLDDLFDGSIKYQKSCTDSKIFADAIKLKNLFDLKTPPHTASTTLSHPHSFFPIETSDDEDDLIFDEEIIQFKIQFVEEPNRTYNSITKYASAYYDAFKSVEKKVEKSVSRESYDELSRFQTSLSENVVPRKPLGWIDGYFSKIAPLFFASSNSIDLKPELCNLERSPFAYLRLLNLIAHPETTLTIEDSKKIVSEVTTKKAIQIITTRDRRTNEIKSKSIKYTPPISSLERRFDRHWTVLTKCDAKNIDILSGKENEDIISRANTSSDYIDHEVASSPSFKIISSTYLDELMIWSEFWNQVDDGFLSIENDQHCLLIQTKTFSPLELDKILNLPIWPHQSILHAYQVLNSIFNFSIYRYKLSHKRANLKPEYLKRAGMAAYTQALLLTLVDGYLESTGNSTDERTQFNREYKDMIERMQINLERQIKIIKEMGIIRCSIGLLHSALLIIYDYKLGPGQVECPDQFRPILEHYLFFNLFLDSNNFDSFYVIDHMSFIYTRRLFEFLSIQMHSEKDLPQLVDDIFTHGYKVFDETAIEGARWSFDRDESKINNFLITNESLKVNLNVFSGEFGNEDWVRIRILNPTEWSVNPEIKDLLDSFDSKGSQYGGRIWYTLSTDVKIGISQDTTQSDTAILHYEGENFDFKFKWTDSFDSRSENPGVEEEDSADDEALNSVASSLFRPFLYNPPGTGAEFYVWHNRSKHIIMDKNAVVHFQICKNTGISGGLSSQPRHDVALTDFVRWKIANFQQYTDIQAAGPVEAENFINKNFISRNTNENYEPNNYSMAIIGFQQRPAQARNFVTRTEKNPVDGFMVPPYRFDPKNPSTLLVIMKVKRSKDSVPTLLMGSEGRAQSNDDSFDWVVQHEMRYIVEEDQDLCIGGVFVDHNFIIVSSGEKWFALAPINNPWCFNPRNGLPDGTFESNYLNEPPLNAISRLVAIDIDRSQYLISESIYFMIKEEHATDQEEHLHDKRKGLAVTMMGSDDHTTHVVDHDRPVLDGDQEHPVTKRDHMIVSKISPSSREHLIFMAYYCLGKRMYPEALRYLKTMSVVTEFSDNEMELLEMFSDMSERTKDFFPEAVAIRIYVAYLIGANAVTFNSCSLRQKREADTMGTSMKWKVCKKAISTHLLKDFEIYFAIENNLSPLFTILDLRDERKGLLSRDESIQLLFEHWKPENSHAYPDTVMFLSENLKIATKSIEYVTNESSEVNPRLIEDINDIIYPRSHSSITTQIIPADQIRKINFARPHISVQTLKKICKNSDAHEFIYNLVKYCDGSTFFKELKIGRLALKLLCLGNCSHPSINSKLELLTQEDRDFLNRLEADIRSNEDINDASPVSRESSGSKQVVKKWDKDSASKDLSDLNRIINLVWPSPTSLPIHLVSAKMKFNGNYLKYSVVGERRILDTILEADSRNNLRVSIDAEKTGINNILEEENALSSQIMSFINESGQSSTVYEDQIQQDILESVDFKFKEEIFMEKHGEFIKELNSGISEYQKLSTVENFHIEDPMAIERFKPQIVELKNKYRDNCNTFKRQIMNMWNSKMDLASYSHLLPERRRDVPSTNEIFSILAKQTRQSIIDVFPGIDVGIIQPILDLIVEYAFNYTGMQHWDKVLRMINESISLPEFYRQIEKKRNHHWIKMPWIMSFEAAADIRLKEDQVNVISLLGTKDTTGNYKQKIVQRLMAYGKTFVLGTSLALAKADGHHLSIIIPPKSLLETNAKDMSARANQFFSQQANLVIFHREKDMETESNILLSIISTMQRTITERGFLIMTIETVQALINQWIIIKRQISLIPADQRVQIEKSEENYPMFANLKLLSFIFRILGERGVALFDEIDMTFDPFKDLSFPLKEKMPIDTNIISMIIHVIQKMANEIEFKRETQIDITIGNQSNYAEHSEKFLELITEYTADWIMVNLGIPGKHKIKEFLRELDESKLGDSIEELIVLKSAFTSKIMQSSQIGSINTLENDETTTKASDHEKMISADPNSILKSHRAMENKQSREILSAAHLLVNHWLERDLKSKIGVTMGRALNPKYLFARPYIAANTPKESSEFSNKWQTVILTCLMYANLGLTGDQVNGWIEYLKSQGHELCVDPENPSLDLDLPQSKEQETFVRFARATLKQDDMDFLKLISVHHKKDIEYLQTRLERPVDNLARDVVFEYIQHIVFSKYSVFKEQVFSTALDASGIFKTYQGYSGTLPNTYIFDHRVTKKEEAPEEAAIILDQGVNGMATFSMLMAARKEESLVIKFDGFDGEYHEVEEAEDELPSTQFSSSIQKQDSISLKIDERLDTFLTDLKKLTREEIWNSYTSLIDVGAEFKKFKTLDIALAILKHLGLESGNRIKCVVFFDEESNQQKFLKFSTEYGLQLRDLPPTPKGRVDMDLYTEVQIGERFIIYGQRHITGVDIEQPQDSRAIITLSKDCTLRDLLQGAFRMRKILLKQRVDFLISTTYSQIVTKKLNELKKKEEESCATPPESTVSVLDLVIMAAYYQYDKGEKENRAVVFQKINAALIKHMIVGNVSSEEDEIFNKIYDSWTFVRTSKDDFWREITRTRNDTPIVEVLMKYKESRLASFLLPGNKGNIFDDEATEIIGNYPNPAEEIKANDELEPSDEDGAPKENEVEVEAEVELEVKVHNIGLKKQETGFRQSDLKNVKKKASPPIPIEWTSLIRGESPHVQLLSSLISRTDDSKDEPKFFSENIYASINYIQTGFDESISCEFSNDIRGYYRKYPFAILIIPSRDSKPLKSVLLSNFDVHFIIKMHLKELSEERGVLLSPSGHPLMSRTFLMETTADSSKKFDVEKYLQDSKSILEDESVGEHLAKISLFSGNFEMLDNQRYPRLCQSMDLSIKENPEGFVKFLEDDGNYFIKRKEEEYKDSWLFERYLKIKSTLFKEKTMAM